jgi:putative ABC transport system permease protein
VSPSNLLHLYRVRLRARFLQECFAVLGIAAGVALLFASQVASSSLQSSVSDLSRAVVGKATLQLIARDPHGFPEGMLARVRHIPGVRVAAPVLESGANAIGPKGHESVQLIGADSSLRALGGSLVRHTTLEPFGGIGAIVLPAPLARTLGVQKFGQEATLQLAGHSEQAPLYGVLHQNQVGALISSPVVVAPLFYVQELTGLGARVSRILVAPAPGAEARVRAALLALASGRLSVEPSNYDEELFANAAQAQRQTTALFAVISALVGFLFAFNAMLLTVPQRRRLIADLRRDGYGPRTVIVALLIDAVVLGLAGCALGLVLGDELSIHLFHSNTAFLSLAFAVGSERVVGWQSIALAVGGGMLAAIVAVLSPLRDILSRDPLAAIRAPETAGSTRAGVRLALVGLAALVAATLVLIVAPEQTIPGMVLLVAALLATLPLALGAMLALARRLARSVTGAVAHVAPMELSAARARAVAITATGAVAVFGTVAIQGAHGDLLSGLRGATNELNSLTDVWVSPAGSYNLLNTTPFSPDERATLARLPGVRAVRVYRGGLLDWGKRRVWVSAPPRQATPLLPASQILEGNPRQAIARLRAGGWLVLSRALAQEHHLRVGDSVVLPTPRPTRMRVAALTTNLGWAPGAIAMNADDYARAWASQDASAYNVLLRDGVSPHRGVAEIRRALGPGTGLAVQTAAAHASAQQALSRQALTRLTQVATLIPIAAVLAMAAAMSAMVWQRRPRLAKLKLEGFPRTELWHTILLESLLLLAVGCSIGALFGLYGEQLADHSLASVVNFPVVYSLTLLTALQSLAVVVAAALAILAVPGYFAARVPAALALQD